MEELFKWLVANKIQYTPVDNEIVLIPGMGKMYFQDMENFNSIFRKDKDGNVVFNLAEDVESLSREGVNYVVFQFGDNFYYSDLANDFKMNILKHVGKRTEPSVSERFVNLGVHTYYELLNGSFSPKMWAMKAKHCGHTAIGICDMNTMAGCYALQKACDEAEITPVFGYSLNFETHTGEKVAAKVYVQTEQGWRNLLRIQKAIMVDSENKTIPFAELLNRGEGNALVLSTHSSQWLANNPYHAKELYEAFDRAYYQVDLAEYRAERFDIQVLENTKLYFTDLYDTTDFRPILLCDAYYLDQSDYNNKLILNKIAEGAAHMQSHEQYFRDADEHIALFQQLFDETAWYVEDVFGECCESTLEIAENANFRIDNSRNFMPIYLMTPEEKERYGDSRTMFNQLLEEGLNKLIPEEDREKYRKQMEYEKYVIESTNNVDYLLVQYDTCNWARQNNILVGCGRGSAAGSLLLYLLGITLIDPIKYDLIFERFLLPERAGLFAADTTIVGENILSKRYIEVGLENGKTLKIDCDAELMVKSGDSEPRKIYADELQEGDDILWDNRDLLFTLNEICN